MNKILGYIVAIIGLIILLTSQFPQFKTALKPLKPLTQIAQIPDLYLTIGGVIIILIGVFLIIKDSTKKSKISELPIYKGKDLIGFRRF